MTKFIPVIVLIAILVSIKSNAQVTISSNTDAGCVGTFISLQDIVIAETQLNDFDVQPGPGGTIVISAGLNQFSVGVGTPSITGTLGVSLSVSAGSLTVTIDDQSSSAHLSELNTLTISGLQVMPGGVNGWTINESGGTLSVNGLSGSGAPVAYVWGDSPPDPSNAGTDQTVCNSASLSANLPAVGTGAWSAAPAGGVFSNTADPLATFSAPAGVYTLTWTITNSNCAPEIDTVLITFENPAVANAGPDQGVCEGSTPVMAGSVGGSATVGTWSTAGDGSFNSSNDLNAIYTPGPTDLSAGFVLLTLTTDDPAGTCPSGVDDVLITFEMPATANAGPDLYICAMGAAQMAGSIGGSATSAYWGTSGDGSFNNPNLLNAIYTPGAADIFNGYAILTLYTDDPPGACFGVSDPMFITINPCVNVTDSLALVDLYNAAGGAGWTNKLNWLTGNVPGWYGVNVSGDRVVGINLSGNALNGTIPGTIGNLVELVNLNLSNNNLTGGIPSTIGNLAKLQTLYIESCALTGGVPAQIGDLVSLQELSLASNDLSGGIPLSIGSLTQLYLLWLKNNNFTGTIPATIGNLTSLAYLDLSNNSLIGSIPAALANASASLVTLGLNNNQLAGAFPLELSNLPLLQYLFLQNNQLTDVPALSYPSLNYGDVSMNYLNFDSFLPNISFPDTVLQKSPQKEIPAGPPIQVVLGDPFSFGYDAGGDASTSYSWIKVNVGPHPETTGTISSASAQPSDAGYYFLMATHPSLPAITLTTSIFEVQVISPDIAEEAGYDYLTKYGGEALGIEPFYPERSAVDPSGNIFFSRKNKIIKIDPNGNILLEFGVAGNGPGQFQSVSDMAFDSNGNIYVTDEVRSKILKFDPSGNFILEWGEFSAFGIAINSADEILVANMYNTLYSPVRVYNTVGNPIDSLGSWGNAVGQFQNPYDLAFDASGNVYVTDNSRNKLIKYNAAYSYVNEVDSYNTGYISGITIDPTGEIYIADFEKIHHFGNAMNFIGDWLASGIGPDEFVSAVNVVSVSEGLLVVDPVLGFKIFNNARTLVRSIGPARGADGVFNSPGEIAADTKGNRYISDYYNGRIQKLDRNGNFVASIGSYGTADGQFKYPKGLAFDAAGNFYVADELNNRIQKFSPDGTFLLAFGTQGSAGGEFYHPNAIAVLKNGNIAVSDFMNSRIQLFAPDGTFISTFGTAGTAPGEFDQVHALAVQIDGYLLVADGNAGNARIQKFSEDGTFVAEYRLAGAVGMINGLATDSEGNIYITDGKVRKFDANLGLLTSIGTMASTPDVADGEFENAFGIQANAAGDTLWVSDESVNRISVFTARFKSLSATDSLALVDFYNGTSGPAWTNATNWLTGPVDTWYGVQMTGGKVRGIVLENNNLAGTLPLAITALDELNTLDLSGNGLTGPVDPPMSALNALLYLDLSDNALDGDVSGLPFQLATLRLQNNFFTSVSALPVSVTSLDISSNRLATLGDLSGQNLQSLNVANNALTFEDLEPNMTITDFTYTPQDSVENPVSVLVDIGSTQNFTATIGGSANEYEWLMNGAPFTANTTATLTLDNISFADDATYHYRATSPLVPGLTLTSRLFRLKVSSLERDSIALAILYEKTNGAAWTENTNWLGTPLRDDNWFGITITNNRVTAITLPANNMSGNVPASLADMTELLTIDVSDNSIESLPDLAGLPLITSLNVSRNKLSFGSLEYNAGITGIDYSDQAELGATSTTYLPAGSPVLLDATTSGVNNIYQWQRNDENIPSTAATLQLEAIGRSNMGRYVCEITNSTVPGLVLRTATDTVFAVTTMSGHLLAAAEVPVTGGTITLLRITSEGAYDTTRITAVNENGLFELEEVILDDYQLLGFADTVAYELALPTYYGNTIFWEEADTISVSESNTPGLDILVQYKPTNVPTGRGVISGYVVEDVEEGSGGRAMAPKRVQGAGVAARRVETTGRPGETNAEILTLVDYTFTNEDGEFLFTNLPVGNYRLNIQYPGYPMDEESFVTVNIGEGLEAEKRVEASVEEGKIVVRELVITHVWELEDYHADVYPNPASSFINFRFALPSAGRFVEFYDSVGRKMMQVSAGRLEERIDIRTLPRGSFVISVYDQGGLAKTLHLIVR